MLDFELHEKCDCWTYLKTCGKPVVMYGTGNGADKIFNVFKKYEISVADIFMSNNFYRESATFHGYKLLRYDDIKAKYEDCVIVLAFAAFRRDLLKKIKEISNEYELLVPSVPVFGDDYFSVDTVKTYEKEINETYKLLADEKSKEVFINSLNYRISGKPKYLFDCETERSEIFSNIFKLNDHETFVDLGAYRGDTVEEFLLSTHGKYEKIYAFEPDVKNYEKLVSNMGTLERAEFINKASWCEEKVMSFSGGGGRNSNLLEGNEDSDVVHAIDIDSFLDGRPATYIKMDVEGAEAETLLGLKHTLTTFKPKLIVSAYHKTADIFTLPIVINGLNKDYKIYLRHHPYIPDWETNYYCI